MLRVRVAPGGRLLVEAGEDVLLVAVVDGGWQASELAYGPSRGVRVLPAWTAAECRRRGTDTARWFHAVRDALRTAPRSPLHGGGWALAEHPAPWQDAASFRAAAADWLADQLVEPEPTRGGGATGEVDHFRRVAGSAAALVPLRPLSPPDAPRVRAHRRLLHEGALAPVVLLRVSGLAGHVVLDGHDRLVAARTEGVVPSFACLARTDADTETRAHAAAVDDYERTMALLDDLDADGRLHGPDAHRAGAAHRLADDLTAHRVALTRAWPLGVAEWEAAARRVAPPGFGG